MARREDRLLNYIVYFGRRGRRLGWYVRSGLDASAGVGNVAAPVEGRRRVCAMGASIETVTPRDAPQPRSRAGQCAQVHGGRALQRGRGHHVLRGWRPDRAGDDGSMSYTELDCGGDTYFNAGAPPAGSGWQRTGTWVLLRTCSSITVRRRSTAFGPRRPAPSRQREGQRRLDQLDAERGSTRLSPATVSSDFGVNGSWSAVGTSSTAQLHVDRARRPVRSCSSGSSRSTRRAMRRRPAHRPPFGASPTPRVQLRQRHRPARRPTPRWRSCGAPRRTTLRWPDTASRAAAPTVRGRSWRRPRPRTGRTYSARSRRAHRSRSPLLRMTGQETRGRARARSRSHRCRIRTSIRPSAGRIRSVPRAVALRWMPVTDQSGIAAYAVDRRG